MTSAQTATPRKKPPLHEQLRHLRRKHADLRDKTDRLWSEATRPVLVGQAPSPSATRFVPALFPYPVRSAGARLMRMTDLGRNDYVRRFCRLNLMPHPIYAAVWEPREAAYAAANLMASGLLDGRAVVLLGRKVWEAFGGKNDVDPLVWYAPSYPDFRPACIALLPHPSGRNHWYNDARQAGAAANFMVLLAEGDYPDWSRED